MFRVCDQSLRVLSEWATLAAAKETARIRAREYRNRTFFVCGADGSVIAGYYNSGEEP
jgi:hypothetical protein